MYILTVTQHPLDQDKLLKEKTYEINHHLKICLRNLPQHHERTLY